jgi:hypothetical protein
VINSINLANNDNPRWIAGNQPATLTGLGISRPEPRVTTRGLFRSTTAEIAGWLAGILRRIGAKLFAVNDAEAYWRGWEITQLHGGLSRRYRDRRFETLKTQDPGHSSTLRPWDPQSPCTLRAPSPEAPGIHEDVHEDVHEDTDSGESGVLGGER